MFGNGLPTKNVTSLGTVPKLQSCSGVGVENSSSKKIGRVKNCNKMWTLNSIDMENGGDSGVTEVNVILRWSVTLNHSFGVENSLKKDMRVENHPPLCHLSLKMIHFEILSPGLYTRREHRVMHTECLNSITPAAKRNSLGRLSRNSVMFLQ